MTEERRPRVSENRDLSRTIGPKRDEVTGEWKKQHEELNDLYSSPNVFRVIKSRRQVGHVACMGERRFIQGFGGET